MGQKFTDVLTRINIGEQRELPSLTSTWGDFLTEDNLEKHKKICTLLQKQYDCSADCPAHDTQPVPNVQAHIDSFCDVVKQLAKLTVKTLTVTMKGDIDEINNYCEAIGELANRFDLEIEF